jgi:hypothetical protein
VARSPLRCAHSSPVPNRIPPVLGVFGTCAKRYPALGFEDDVDRLTNSFGGPEALIVSQWDMDSAGAAGRAA